MSHTFAIMRIIGFFLYAMAFVIEERYLIALTYVIPLVLSIYLEALIIRLNIKAKSIKN